MILSYIRRHPYLTLFLAALLYRLFTALFYRQPGYTDAYYYVNVANQLWQGNGFRDDYIWNYMGGVPSNITGNPSNTYWMPLTSLIIAGSYFLTFGQSFFASQLPMMLISSTFAPLACYMGRDIFGPERGVRYGWLMGLFMIFCGFYAPMFALPDNFAPYAFFSLSFLILTYKIARSKESGVRSQNGELTPPSLLGKRAGGLGLRLNFILHPPSFILSLLAGLCAGLAYLTRVDGVILLVVPIACLVLQRYIFRQPTNLTWKGIVIMWLVAAVVVSPWVLRNLAVTGLPFPGGGIKVLFWREYDDFYTFVRPLDLSYYLNQSYPSDKWGIVPLLGSKLDALGQNYLVIGRAALVFLTPLAFLGFFSRFVPGKPLPQLSFRHPDTFWRRPELLPFSVYTVILYLVMSLLFTFPSTRGSLFHSAGGLLPFVYAGMLVGLDAAIGLLGKVSRPGASRSRQQFYTGILVLVMVFASVGWTFSSSGTWDDEYNEIKAVDQWIVQNGKPGALVMSPDPMLYYHATGKSTVVFTSDPLEVNLQVAQRYKASYLIFQPQHYTASLTPLFENKTYPGFKLVATIGGAEIYELSY